MKLVSYLKDEHDQLAMLEKNLLYDTDLLHMELPSSMSMFLNFWEDNYALALKIQQAIVDNRIGKEKGFNEEQANFLAPVPFPTSFRKGFINNDDNDFNFSNHHAIQGSGSVMCMPDHFNQLAFEVSVAVVISKLGRNIPAAEADEYIAGLTIMNNFSSSKRKDFATTIGPYLVTTEELEEFEVPQLENAMGKMWTLNIKCILNGEQVNEANNMQLSFAELIERASYGATLYPGDIITSGIVLTNNINLKKGDVVEIKSEVLGTLKNTIEKEDSDSTSGEEQSEN